jgi:hypothetical protein
MTRRDGPLSSHVHIGATPRQAFNRLHITEAGWPIHKRKTTGCVANRRRRLYQRQAPGGGYFRQDREPLLGRHRSEQHLQQD